MSSEEFEDDQDWDHDEAVEEEPEEDAEELASKKGASLDHAEHREQMKDVFFKFREQSEKPRFRPLPPDPNTEEGLAIIRQRQAKAQRTWRKKNKAKVKAANKRRRERRAKRVQSSVSIDNLSLTGEDAELYQNTLRELAAQVFEEKGVISATDKMKIEATAIAKVRMFRKFKLENKYDKFFDKQAAQDPFNQVIKGLSSLETKQGKPAKEQPPQAVPLSDVVPVNEIKDSLIEDLGENKIPSKEEWEKQIGDFGTYRIERRKDTFDSFNQDDITIDGDGL